MSDSGKINTKILTSCAILIALGVVISRVFAVIPSEVSRFSLEAIPIFLAGLFFGPLAGALVGFATDFLGCLLSPYGFNPIFCLPPILYGLCGGLFRPWLHTKVSLPRLLLALLPAAALGSVLWQSFALDLVYGSGFFILLSTRSIQFAVTAALDALVIWLLFRLKVFQHAGLWTISGNAGRDA